MLVIHWAASARPEVGPGAHLPAAPLPPGLRLSVLRAVCGQIGIGSVFDREGPTCALCLAMTGQHPGKRGKAYLRRLTEEAQHGR